MSEYMLFRDLCGNDNSYIGLKKDYPTIDDLLKVLEEKERFVFDGDKGEIETILVRHGFYWNPEEDKLENGWNSCDVRKGKGALEAWNVLEKDGHVETFIRQLSKTGNCSSCSKSNIVDGWGEITIACDISGEDVTGHCREDTVNKDCPIIGEV